VQGEIFTPLCRAGISANKVIPIHHGRLPSSSMNRWETQQFRNVRTYRNILKLVVEKGRCLRSAFHPETTWRLGPLEGRRVPSTQAQIKRKNN